MGIAATTSSRFTTSYPYMLPASGERCDRPILVLLCANCHRMIHRGKTWLTPAALKQLLAANAGTYHDRARERLPRRTSNDSIPIGPGANGQNAWPSISRCRGTAIGVMISWWRISRVPRPCGCRSDFRRIFTEWLRAYAFRRRVSMAAVVRVALDEFRVRAEPQLDLPLNEGQE